MLSNTLRRAIPFLLFAAGLLILQGCGGSNSDNDGKTVITFWHFWSEPAQKQALARQIKEFEEQNPDLHVELSELSWNDGKTKLLAAFNSNTAPDVIELGSDWVAQFSSSGVLADQSKLGAATAAQFSEPVAAAGKWQNGVFAIPWVIDTRVLYYNKDLLASVGVDTTKADTLWSDVMNHAEQVRAKGGDLYGFGANGPDAHRLYKKIIPFFWSNGGDILGPDGKPVLNSPQNVEALRIYLELARTGLIDTQKGLDGQFLQGKLAYWISGPWLADRIAKDNPGLRYGMAPLPKFPNGQSVSFIGGEYLAINEGSSHKDPAKKLVSFLTSGKQAAEFCADLKGYAPADLSAASDPFQQSPLRRAYSEQLRTSRMTPVHPKWLDIEKAIEDAVTEALLGNKTEQQALDDAQARVGQIVSGNVAVGNDEGH
jgi:multiple sugar transport system substrate-binding protein